MHDDLAGWLSGCSETLDVDLDYLLVNDGPPLQWFRRIYDNLGPIPEVQLRIMLERAREESAKRALEMMKREIRFYHKRGLDAEIEEGPSEWVEGAKGFYFLGAEVRSWILEYSLLEIGDAVQAEIMERDWRVWPVCDAHGVGLHLRKIQDQVVWWCIPYGHVLRRIYPV
jgi:hypothetical protein